LSEAESTTTKRWPRAKAWLKRHRIAILIVIGFFAFLPKGAPAPSKFERDKNAWSECFVYSLAADRMAKGEAIHVLPSDPASLLTDSEARERIDLDVPLHPRLLQKLRGHVYSYPPMLATLALPIASIGNYRIESLLWYLALYAASAASLYLMWRMAMGTPGESQSAGEASISLRAIKSKLWPQGLSQSERRAQLEEDPTTRMIFATLFAIIGLAPFMGPLINQQTDSIITFAAIAGAALLSRGTSGAPYFFAALLLAIAGGAKGPLLILIAWLFWKHRWMGAWRVLFFALLLNGLGDMLFPAFEGGERIYHYQEWFTRVAAPNLASGEAAATTEGIWTTFNHQNQALAATLTRIFAAGDRPEDVLPALIQIGDGARKMLIYGVMALTFGLSLWATRGTPWRKDRNLIDRVWGRASLCKREGEAKERGHIGILRELSVFLILALLFSPMTSPAHLCMALPALLMVMRDAWITRDRVMLIALAVASAILLLVNKSLMQLFALPINALGDSVVDGREIVNSLRFYGIQTWVLVALLVGACRSCLLASRSADVEA